MSSSEKANVVVIGGGIFGCAIAYYYTKNNPGKKIVVLERNELCNSATSRAAALMTIVRSKRSYIPLTLETYRIVGEMEKQLGESLDMKTVGMMHVAASETKVKELDALMNIAETFKQKAYYIGNEEAHQRSPWLKTDEAIKIGFVPNEAYCDPYLLGTFFARCAKMQGADIRQGVEVNRLIMDGNTAMGVVTANNNIYADKVIIAAGAWAPIFAAQAGIGLPMAPVRSQYWITEKATIFPVNSPMVLLPDAQAYARPEGGNLLFGIRESNSFSVSPKEIPADISHFSFSADRGMNDLSEVIDRLGRFFPDIYDIGLKYYVAGFSGYTPDGNLSMGTVPEVNNLLMATGCVGAGIAVAGGVGHAFAELAADKPNPYDFSDFNLQRFGKIDPFSNEWLTRCADARSKKVSG
ncbi:NAD(P)/FAD-dependent oxidoreductase [Terrimonas pollutisoli]|uniref:NAD(P)/FAD-dependent oxidoreductase n=1 Tax=Terrimonas pollutisoli TaxID=3034147 RepID=UPI0023EB6A41|nr:FAD-binding oxidoreductase [Terrimonas sp. H1YJ31]